MINLKPGEKKQLEFFDGHISVMAGAAGASLIINKPIHNKNTEEWLMDEVARLREMNKQLIRRLNNVRKVLK